MPFHPTIVPDVNVMVSGALLSDTPPSQVMEAWRLHKCELATSPPILDELERVLAYPRVTKLTGYTPEQVHTYRQLLEASALVVPGETLVQVSADPDDNKFFACALEAEADYIVSGDRHVLTVGNFQGIQTITPKQMIDRLKAEAA
jgi:putative PIN family toxin of toxin-antitoxin system